jgi:hypothetical protein
MKPSAVVRLMNAIALVLAIGNWFPYFLMASYKGAWEWNCMRLIDMATSIGPKSFSNLAAGHSFQIIAVSALLCGCLPMITALYGILRPASPSLLVVTVVASIMTILSTIILYAITFFLYGQGRESLVEPAVGTYMVIVLIAIEIVAAVFSRKRIAAT